MGRIGVKAFDVKHLPNKILFKTFKPCWLEPRLTRTASDAVGQQETGENCAKVKK